MGRIFRGINFNFPKLLHNGFNGVEFPGLGDKTSACLRVLFFFLFFRVLKKKKLLRFLTVLYV